MLTRQDLLRSSETLVPVATALFESGRPLTSPQLADAELVHRVVNGVLDAAVGSEWKAARSVSSAPDVPNNPLRQVVRYREVKAGDGLVAFAGTISDTVVKNGGAGYQTRAIDFSLVASDGLTFRFPDVSRGTESAIRLCEDPSYVRDSAVTIFGHLFMNGVPQREISYGEKASVLALLTGIEQGQSRR